MNILGFSLAAYVVVGRDQYENWFYFLKWATTQHKQIVIILPFQNNITTYMQSHLIMYIKKTIYIP